MNAKLSKLVIAISATVLAGSAWAVDDTSTMSTSAAVVAECSVGNGTAITLGTLSMLTDAGTQTALNSTASATFPAICTNGTPSPKFSYVSGHVQGGVFRLQGGTTATEFINYTPFPSSDASGASIISGTAVAHPNFSADGTSKTLALSAKILAADKAAKSVQTYSDTITITASFGV